MKGTRKRTGRCLSMILSIALIFTMIPSGSLDLFAGAAEEASVASAPDLTGEGTQASPFEIGSRDDLVKMRDHVNKKEKYLDGDAEKDYSKASYVLTSDIDLQGADGNSWYPIGRMGSGMADGVAFEGVFDGNGHTISGLYINGNDASLDNYDGYSHSTSRVYYFGLFGENKGTIKALSIPDAVLKNLGMYNGIIAGISSGTIENCSTGGSVEGSYCNGGITGSCEGSGTVRNCVSTATSAAFSFGAICGNWTVSTAEVSNNYYPDTTKVSSGANREGVVQAMSADDFSSGKVAWLLQKGQADASVLVWEQKIGVDKYPVIHIDGDGSDRVYKVSFMLEENVVGEDYRNSGDKATAPAVDAEIAGYTAGDKWYKDAALKNEWLFDSDTVTDDTTVYGEKKAVEYTITLALSGGVVSDDDWKDNTRRFTVESQDITLPTPTKSGYRFIGWTGDGDDIVGEAQPTVTVASGSTGSRTYTAVFKDATAPDVTIRLGDHEWHALNEAPAFDLFYNTSQTVEISANDNEDGVLDIKYYISNQAMTEAQLGSANWTSYTGPFTISPEKNYIIYAKVSDDDGNESFIISTTGIVIEVTPPVIKGVTEGGTYCGSAQFTVADANLDYVTIDGEAAEAVAGKFTVSGINTHTVVATDKAGNSTTVSFSVKDHSRGLTTLETVVQPGCETDGTRIRKVYCNSCGALYSKTTETVPALGHSWGDWQTLDMPTCDDNGTEQRQCKRCGLIETSGLVAEGHDWEENYTIDKDATCTEPGSKSIHCSKCPATRDSVEIPVVPHTPGAPTTDSFIDADCTEDGSYVSVINCAVCGTELVRQPVTIPAKGHDFTDWEEIDTPDCEDEGHFRRECRICGTIETQNVAQTGHDWNSEYTVDRDATCTTVGSESIKCKKCGAVKESRIIPSKGHTEAAPIKENVTESTCTASGSYDEVVYCTVCSEEVSRKTVSTAALGHDFGEWTTVDMPNCDDSGTQQRACKVCGYTETRGLDATGHDWESDHTIDTEPTCTAEGSESIKCRKCGAAKDSRVIPAKGHDFGEWTTVDMPNCDDSGTQQRTCKVCGYTETKGLDATGHDWESDHTVDIEPTCTTEGSESIKCRKCGAVKDSRVIPAKGHSYTEKVIAPTPTSQGYTLHTCTVCGYEYKDSYTDYPKDNVLEGTVEFAQKLDGAGVTIELVASNGVIYEATVNENGSFSVPMLPDGTYTLIAEKKNCAPHDYIVTIKNGAAQEKINAVLKLYGDVSGDGKVTAVDCAMVNAYVMKTGSLDDYDLKVANVVGSDSKVTAVDCSRINAHVQKTNLLW